jgi:hypothetical protein
MALDGLGICGNLVFVDVIESERGIKKILTSMAPGIWAWKTDATFEGTMINDVPNR